MFPKMKKGDVILHSGWYYVVIFDRGTSVDCVCDNANNAYNWDKNELLTVHMTARQAVEINCFGFCGQLSEADEELCREVNRPIPIDVIAEALVGLHDHRF